MCGDFVSCRLRQIKPEKREWHMRLEFHFWMKRLLKFVGSSNSNAL